MDQTKAMHALSQARAIGCTPHEAKKPNRPEDYETPVTGRGTGGSVVPKLPLDLDTYRHWSQRRKIFRRNLMGSGRKFFRGV